MGSEMCIRDSRCCAMARGSQKTISNVITLAVTLWKTALCAAGPYRAHPPATNALSSRQLPSIPSRIFPAGSAAIRCLRRHRHRRCRCSRRFRRRRRGRLSSRQRPRPRPDPPRLQAPPRAQHRWTAITCTYRGPFSDAKTLSACSWNNALTRTRRATLATPRRTFVPAGSAAILPSCHRRRPLSRRYCDAFQPILTTVVGKQAGITRLAWMHRRS